MGATYIIVRVWMFLSPHFVWETQMVTIGQLFPIFKQIHEMQ